MAFSNRLRDSDLIKCTFAGFKVLKRIVRTWKSSRDGGMHFATDKPITEYQSSQD